MSQKQIFIEISFTTQQSLLLAEHFFETLFWLDDNIKKLSSLYSALYS